MDEKPETPAIQPRATYWIEFAGVRFQVEAIRESSAVPGWWWCRAKDGKEAIFSAHSLEAQETK